MTKVDFAPGELVARFCRRWPVFIALMVVGGLLGWVATLFRAPQYQAGAVLDVGFDYSLTLPLTRDAEGYVRERVRSLLLSDSVLRQALAALPEEVRASEGVGDLARLRERIQLADRRTTWTFFVTAGSPENASTMANSWASVSVGVLREAVSHAWRAADLQAAFFNLGCTLVEPEGLPGTAVWDCRVDRSQSEPEELAEAIRREAELSFGVVPALSIVQLNEAPLPDRPILWGRGSLILAGLLLGGLLGLAVTVRAM